MLFNVDKKYQKLHLIIVEFFTYSFLALYSVDYYIKVFKNFKGWGLRYIVCTNLITSLIIICPIYINFKNLENFFSSNQLSSTTVELDHIINQFPDLNFDGKFVSLADEQPYYLYDMHNQPIIVIDTLNSALKYKSIPVVINQDKIIIHNITGKFSLSNNYLQLLNSGIKYTDLFNSSLIESNDKDLKSTIINCATLKKILHTLVNSMLKIFVVLGAPLLFIVNFMLLIFDKLLKSLVIYLFINFKIEKTTFQNSFRLVVFSSSIASIVIYLSSYWKILHNLNFFCEAWSIIIICISLLKYKKLSLK